MTSVLSAVLSLAAFGAVAMMIACLPADRDTGTIVVASGADLESANPLVTVHPLSRQIQRYMLYVTLVKLDSALTPTPYFAHSWEWDETHTRVRFHLRDDLQWHDGVPTTAHDVVFSYTAVKDRALSAPRAGDLDIVAGIDAADDSTVVIRFRTRTQELPVVFAELPIAPMHILDSVPRERWRSHAFSTAPTGNGPFRFAGRIPGRLWRFVRNENFPVSMGGPPAIEQLIVAVVDEPSTKFAGLVSGELDLAGVSPVMARLVERDPSLELLTPPVLFTTLIAFNTARRPFDDVRVRRAVSLSLDRDRMVHAAVAGFGEPAGSSLPSGMPMSTSFAPIRDPALADSLLDAAGWLRGDDGMRMAKGKRLSATLLTVGSGDLAIEQLVQADLRARGVDVSIRTAELATFLALLRAPEKDYDFALTGIPGDVAAGHIRALFAGSLRGGALDYTGWHSEQLDSAFAAVDEAAGADGRAEAWRHVDAILNAHVPVAWIYHARGVQGKTRQLGNVIMDLRGELVNVTEWERSAKPKR